MQSDAKKSQAMNPVYTCSSKRDARWESMYEALHEFRLTHGHCRVPTAYSENPALGRWVASQRHLHGLGELDARRRQKLDAEGFVWSADDAAWETMYGELLSYHQNHGHCNVPQNYSGRHRLGVWVQNQRQVRRRGRMQAARAKRLEAINFRWSAQDD